MNVLSEAARAFNLDPETALDRRLRELRDETYPDELPPEIGDSYQPTDADREWMCSCDLDSFVPRGLPLAAWVREQARQHRIRDDEPRHGWIAEHLDRLAQLVDWTGATTPAEHDDRLEVYDRELRERHYANENVEQ